MSYPMENLDNAFSAGKKAKEKGFPKNTNPHMVRMNGLNKHWGYGWEEGKVQDTVCDHCNKVIDERALTLSHGEFMCHNCESDDPYNDELNALALTFMECFPSLVQTSLDEFMTENNLLLTTDERKVGNAILAMFNV